jgi:hypothetical protein
MVITSHRVLRCLRALSVAELFMRYYSEDYRGVHALTKIPTDDVILYVPYKYIMTSEVAKGSEIGKKIIASGVELRSTHSYLAAYLLQEKHKGKKSFWEPYLRILPEFYNNMVRPSILVCVFAIQASVALCFSCVPLVSLSCVV